MFRFSSDFGKVLFECIYFVGFSILISLNWRLILFLVIPLKSFKVTVALKYRCGVFLILDSFFEYTDTLASVDPRCQDHSSYFMLRRSSNISDQGPWG